MVKIIDKERLIKYLEYSKNHYTNLSKFMKRQEKDKYSNEHKGKVKFINLLLHNIEKGEYNEV